MEERETDKEFKTDNRFVVTENIEPTQIEIAVDSNGHVDAISLDYNDYRNMLISTYKKSSKDNSIISTFSIMNDKCTNNVIIRNSYDEDKRQERVFTYNHNFINSFLIPMVKDYNKENEIKDISIEVLDENRSNLIIKANMNDSLVLLGINMELSNKLKELGFDDKKIEIIDRKNLDNNGIGNSMAIILTLGIIIVILIIIIAFSLLKK